MIHHNLFLYLSLSLSLIWLFEPQEKLEPKDVGFHPNHKTYVPRRSAVPLVQQSPVVARSRSCIVSRTKGCKRWQLPTCAANSWNTMFFSSHVTKPAHPKRLQHHPKCKSHEKLGCWQSAKEWVLTKDISMLCPVRPTWTVTYWEISSCGILWLLFSGNPDSCFLFFGKLRLLWELFENTPLPGQKAPSTSQ